MNFQPQPQKPIYVLSQGKKRVIIPKVIIFLFLSTIFYLGILLNLSLLELRAREEMTVKLASLAVLVLVVLIGTILSFRRANFSYIFYNDRLVFKKKKFPYLGIREINPHKNFFDKLFNTYSLRLDKNFLIEHIPEEIQLQEYLQQLRAYAQQLQ